MNHGNKTIRFFSVVLIVGGVVGIAIAIVIGVQLIAKNWLLGLAMGALLALFAWSVFVGARLWLGTPYGRKWATILFASQIPLLTFPGLTYQWFTGAFFGPVIQLSDKASQLTFGANVGANGQFFVGGQTTGLMLGVNLFAVIAVVLLVRANSSVRDFPSTPGA